MIYFRLESWDQDLFRKVTITGQAQSDRISLHQKDLEITSVEVAGQARPFTVDHDNEALHIELVRLVKLN